MTKKKVNEKYKQMNRFQNAQARKAFKKIINNKSNKKRNSLIRMATGTGKTHVMAKVIKKYFEYLKNNNRRLKPVLILTHLQNLVDQIPERLDKRGIEIKNVTKFDGRMKELGGDVVVANVNSFSKKRVLEKINKSKFGLILADECHHSAAATWERVLDHFSAPRIGFTATPYRPDSKNILDIFGGELDVNLDFTKAQEKGFIPKGEGRIVLTNAKLEGIETKDGDYSPKALDKIYHLKDRMNIIVKSYKEYGQSIVKKNKMKPKALCFCINVKHAEAMSKFFNKEGIKSKFLAADNSVVSKKDRAEIEHEFINTNNIEVLCVVGLFGEGTDVPDCNIVLMARPTRSPILYSQQLGRASRIFHNKKKFILIDFVDNIEAGFSPYTCANLENGAYFKTEIVTEWVKKKDSIKINKRAKDLVKNFNKFEENMDKYYIMHKASVAELKKALETGVIYVPDQKL